MHNNQQRLTHLIALALFMASLCGAQDKAIQQTATAKIHSTTRLVQLSVVVMDKKGEPVAGLNREDFTVFEEGKPQDIAFFSAGLRAPTAPLATLPPNAFTNRLDLKGQDPGAVTVILFDALNTSATDQMYIRKQILSFLRDLKPQDRVAVYALTKQLMTLHEFTLDASALVRSVSQFTPKELAEFDASNVDSMNILNMTDNPQEWPAIGAKSSGDVAGRAMQDRIELTTGALRAIAEHVAAIPGRKNLIWVSGGFPGLGVNVTKPNRDPREADWITSTIEALNRVNVAIYPVDAHGVEIETGVSPVSSGPQAKYHATDTPRMFEEQEIRDTFRVVAERTGGKAFYGSNDIHDALVRASEDSRFAYTIGYYPENTVWDGKFREIGIKLRQEGMKLRYRRGYFATGEYASSEAQGVAALQEAAIRPLDATGLAMIVSGNLDGIAVEHKVELHVGLDPKQLLLEEKGNRRRGGIDLYFLQRGAKGETVAAESQRVGLDLEEKQYADLSNTGLVLGRHVTIAPEAAELRVLVRDVESEALGSVTIPVNALLVASKNVAESQKTTEHVTGKTVEQPIAMGRADTARPVPAMNDVGKAYPTASSPEAKIRVETSLVLVDVISESSRTGMPARDLKKEDFRVLDNDHEVAIDTFDAGVRYDTRPVIVWLVVICNERGKIGGSAQFSGKEPVFRPGLDHMDKRDLVGVAHWCDNGETGIDLVPTESRDSAIRTLAETIKPIRFNSADVTNLVGEAAFRKSIRLIIQDALHRNPQPLPVVVFLDGDYTGQPPRELDELVDDFLQTSGIVFGIKDKRSPKVPRLRYEQGEILHYMAAKTGGQYFSVAEDGYAAALEMILMQVHFRYELGFTPASIDGKRHELKVVLTKDAQEKYKGVQLRFRPEYIPVAQVPSWAR